MGKPRGGSLLALEEALGPARGARAGLWAGLAFLSRQLCVYLNPFIARVVCRCCGC